MLPTATAQTIASGNLKAPKFMGVNLVEHPGPNKQGFLYRIGVNGQSLFRKRRPLPRSMKKGCEP